MNNVLYGTGAASWLVGVAYSVVYPLLVGNFKFFSEQTLIGVLLVIFAVIIATIRQALYGRDIREVIDANIEKKGLNDPDS